MWILATSEVGLAVAAVPTAIGTVLASRYAYLATRKAAPALQTAQNLEPRLSEVERVSHSWKEIIDAKDEQLEAKDSTITFWQTEAKRHQAASADERKIAEGFAQKADQFERAYKEALGTIETLQHQLDLALRGNQPSVPPPVAD